LANVSGVRPACKNFSDNNSREYNISRQRSESGAEMRCREQCSWAHFYLTFTFTCLLSSVDRCCSEFTSNKSLYLTIDTEACKGLENQINFLEHVQAFITLKATRRGDVTLYLVSPMNTTWAWRHFSQAVFNIVYAYTIYLGYQVINTEKSV